MPKKKRTTPITKKKLYKLLLTTLIGLLLYGFFALFEEVNSQRLPSSDHPAELYSNQTRDDLRITLVQAMQQAKKSIVLVIYTLTDPKIISTLRERAEEGIDVLVVCDADASRAAIKKLGSKVTTVKRISKGLMHQKILIIDDKQTWIGSANMTSESLRMHGNLIVAIESPHVAELAKANAQKMQLAAKGAPLYHQTYGLGAQTMEFWLLPDDHQRAIPRLLSIINDAQKSLRIAMFTWTRKDLAQAVIRAHQRGVDVEVVIDRNAGKGAGAEIVDILVAAGVPVSLSQGVALLHYKMLYVDDRLLVNGSANWTKAAFGKNDDCFIVLYDLNEKQKERMQQLWHAISTEAEHLEPQQMQEAA